MLKSALDPKSLPLILRTIYIRGSRMGLSDDFDPLVPGQELRGQFRHTDATVNKNEIIDTASGRLIGHTYTFLTRFEFRYDRADISPTQNDETNENTLAAISSEIAAVYNSNSEEILSDAEIAQWGQTSVLVHCWPYWRELCHSATARMNLPITLMPMLDVQAVSKSIESDTLSQSESPKAKVTVKKSSAGSLKQNKSQTVKVKVTKALPISSGLKKKRK